MKISFFCEIDFLKIKQGKMADLLWDSNETVTFPYTSCFCQKFGLFIVQKVFNFYSKHKGLNFLKGRKYPVAEDCLVPLEDKKQC